MTRCRLGAVPFWEASWDQVSNSAAHLREAVGHLGALSSNVPLPDGSLLDREHQVVLFRMPQHPADGATVNLWNLLSTSGTCDMLGPVWTACGGKAGTPSDPLCCTGLYYTLQHTAVNSLHRSCVEGVMLLCTSKIAAWICM